MDVASKFLSANELYSLEGRRGLESLALLCGNLGYKDSLNNYGQFHQKTPTGFHDGRLGDIFEFLEDNPGAIEAIVNWVDEQNIPEWNETVPPDEEEEDEEEEEVHFKK